MPCSNPQLSMLRGFLALRSTVPCSMLFNSLVASSVVTSTIPSLAAPVSVGPSWLRPWAACSPPTSPYLRSPVEGFFSYQELSALSPWLSSVPPPNPHYGPRDTSSFFHEPLPARCGRILREPIFLSGALPFPVFQPRSVLSYNGDGVAACWLSNLAFPDQDDSRH